MFKKTLHHVAVVVSDLEKSVQFYRDILGFKVFLCDTFWIGVGCTRNSRCGRSCILAGRPCFLYLFQPHVGQ